MALIHSETFDIINETNIEDGKGAESEYFEVDDLIAIPIALLNKKGYRTLACCSGHPFDNIVEIVCNSREDCENLPCLICEGPKNGGYHFVQRFGDNGFYIMFDNEYFKNYHLPKNFTFDEYNCMRNVYTTLNSSFDRIEEIVDTIKILYQWVKKLPNF